SGVGALLVDRTRAIAQTSTPEAPRPTRLEEGRPSLTAQSTARLRGAHQLLDQPRILDDPLALRILGAQVESDVRAYPQRDAFATTIRAFVSLRSRYTEDELGRAVEGGVRQYVVLGAGLDTFAYRSPYP